MSDAASLGAASLGNRPTALIGHTGFVGGNLLRQRRYARHYNSTSIAAIDGERFAAVVCAGVSAVKWWANQHPEEDLARIEELIAHLDRIEADDFTLISTVDVYAHPVGVTEADQPASDGLHPYGTNRLMLERWVGNRFPRHQIVRLPALFGHGLKKNAIFDLMRNNRLQVINGASAFQWYPLDRLADDLDLARERRLGVVNLAVEPVATEEIRARFFADRRIGADPAPACRYDMRTVHAAAFGAAGGYVLDRAGVLAALERFLLAEAGAAGPDAAAP